MSRARQKRIYLAPPPSKPPNAAALSLRAFASPAGGRRVWAMHRKELVRVHGVSPDQTWASVSGTTLSGGEIYVSRTRVFLPASELGPVESRSLLLHIQANELREEREALADRYAKQVATSLDKESALARAAETLASLESLQEDRWRSA